MKISSKVITLFIVCNFGVSTAWSTTLTGEGYGSTAEMARKQALAALSESIAVEIKSEFQSIETQQGLEEASRNIQARSDLPLLGAEVETYRKTNEYYSTAKLSSQVLKLYQQKLKQLSNELADMKSQLANKKLSRQIEYALLNKALTQLDQYGKYRTVAFALGDKGASEGPLNSVTLQSRLISLSSEATELGFAAELLSRKLPYKNILVSPASVEGSHEITPLSRALRDKIAAHMSVTSDPNAAQYYYKGKYEIVKNGIHVTYQLSDTEGNTLATRSVKLLPAAYQAYAYKPRTIDFDKLLYQGVVVSNDFKVSVNTNRGNENLLFTADEEIELFVKLNRAGYFYIVSHVKKPEENSSYLLEISDAPAPRKFIQYVNADDANRWLSLGKFVVSPPYGVESLQIIASTQDLAGKLPPYKYDNATELYMVFDGKPGDAVIRTRGLKPKKNKSKNIMSAEAVLMMTTTAKQEH